MAPYQSDLQGIAVESTFNWYWLVDGLEEAGYVVHLVNTVAVKQYDGLKHTNDVTDAFHLAHLMRLGILPTGYIYPKEERALRDLLRRRLQIVHLRSSLVLSLQSQIWRSQGIRVSANELRHPRFTIPEAETYLSVTTQTQLSLIRFMYDQVRELEQQAIKQVKQNGDYQLIQTVNGIGSVLGLTIVMETGDITRFQQVGNYSSYCRLVNSSKTSNGKYKGKGNTKNGNKYLSWAYSEAAHYAVRYDDNAKRFYQRKKQKTNGIIAIRAVAHKLARASYYILRDKVPYRSELLFR